MRDILQLLAIQVSQPGFRFLLQYGVDIFIPAHQFNTSSVTGVFALTSRPTTCPITRPRYFGANPYPGRTLRTQSSVITSPAFISFTKYSERRNWALPCSLDFRP